MLRLERMNQHIDRISTIAKNYNSSEISKHQGANGLWSERPYIYPYFHKYRYIYREPFSPPLRGFLTLAYSYYVYKGVHPRGV